VTNHPNRHWRLRMQQAADQWQETSAGKLLAEVPFDFRDPAAFLAGLRKRLRQAYLCGYQDGRKREDENER